MSSCPSIILNQIGPLYFTLITSLAIFSVIFLNSFRTCQSCRTWGIRINHFTHKQWLIYQVEYLLVPLLWYPSTALCEHGTCCGWGCLTSSILYTLVTPVTSHFWIDLGVLLIWPLRPILHVWFYLVGAFTVSVEPLRIVYGGVSATPELQWGVSPIYFLSYDIFDRIHVHGHGLPVGILLASLYVKGRVFLIQPVRSISGFMIFSSWVHEPH